MFSKTALAATLPIVWFILACVHVCGLANDGPVYSLQNALLTRYDLENGRIAVKHDGNLPTSAAVGNVNNWIIETEAKQNIVNPVTNALLEQEGHKTQYRAKKVYLDSPPALNLVIFELNEKLNQETHRIRFIFQSSTGPIVLDRIDEFSKIEVLFGKKFPPEDGVLKTLTNWLITVIDLPSGTEARLRPDDVFINHSLKMAVLKTSRKLSRETQNISVRFQFQNFPETALGRPKQAGASSAFEPARGKSDADIYFSGAAAGARESKPLYLFEAKLGYLWDLGRSGSLGAKASADAAKESNIDPDSIKFSGAYEKVLLFTPRTGLILRSDLIGGEFDTKNRTRNLATGLDATLVLPSVRLGEGSFATMDFLGGFEGGHNYRHKLNEEEGLGNFWRWKLGANAYFVALNPRGFKRINASTEYKVRLLRSFEPFTVVVDGKEETKLRKKPRHYVATDVDLMFTDAFGISLKYRYGSLPPAYNFINNSVSIGLTFQLKQAN